jgi:hypothetical protein
VWGIPGVEESTFGGDQHAPLIILPCGRQGIDRHILDRERLEVGANPLAKLVVEVGVSRPVGQSQCGVSSAANA